MGIIDELNQVIHNLRLNEHVNKHPVSRNEIAHFCEHDGIFIHFTQAPTTWHALAPCALKPWWLFLKPLRKNLQNNRAAIQRDAIQTETRTDKRNKK